MISWYKQQRSGLLVFLTHNLALPVLKRIRKPELFPYSLNELNQMEDGTVGKDLYTFLQDKNLVLLAHYARHDMKHLLLQFDTTEEGELCMQAFMLGNGRVSFPVLITVIFGIVTPEYWRKMIYSIIMGRSCNSIHHWDWFSLIPLNTIEVRNKIFTIKN